MSRRVRSESTDELKFRQGKERQDLIAKYLQSSNQVCLLFLFDATSSMHSKIDLVKTQCTEMFQSVKETYGQVQIKAGVVAYRDFDQGNDHTEVLDFTGNITKFKSFLSSVHAVGGGDAAEDVFTGLEKAASLSWSDYKGATKLICHIADAPCHGSAFHNMRGSWPDDHLSGDPKGRDIAVLLRNLFEKCRITRYFFSHLNNSTVKMIKEFRKAAPEADWLQDDHVQNDEALKDFICGSIISSVTVSRSMSGSAPRGKERPVAKNYQIDSREPDWGSLPILNGTNCMHEILSNPNELLEALKGPLPLGKEFSMKLKIAPKPFSNEGVSRYPFHAIWLNAPAGKGVQEERRVVLKEFKYDRGYVKWIGKIDYRDRSQYLVQGEVQTAASVMAQQFNKDIRDIRRICPSVQEIRFPQVRVVSVQHSLSKEKHYNMEPLLQSTDGSTLDFVRFTNNNGAIGKQGLNHEFSDTVLAFSHYTYQKTNKRLMVTDLQGCWCKTPRGEKQFTLSDPMIHSDEFFLRAAGNFGKQGAAAFFKSHRCNDVCRALGLFPVTEFDAASGARTSSRSAVSSISAASTSTAASSASTTYDPRVFGSYM